MEATPAQAAWITYISTLVKINKEYERGLMVDYELAERVLFLTADYLKVK